MFGNQFIWIRSRSAGNRSIDCFHNNNNNNSKAYRSGEANALQAHACFIVVVGVAGSGLRGP